MKTWMLLSAAAFALPAMADTHISYVSDAGQPGVQMYVREGKLRIESPADHRIALYDMSTHTLTVLLPDQKKYLQFDGLAAWNSYVAAHTPAPIPASNGSDQANTAMDQAKLTQDQVTLLQQQAMAQVTASQDAAMGADNGTAFADQAMAQANMASQQAQIDMDQMTLMQDQTQETMDANSYTPPPTPSVPQPDIKDMGGSETVAGHGCWDVEVGYGGNFGPPLCLETSPEALGIPPADLGSLLSMRDSMNLLRTSLGPLARRMNNWLADGFVLKTTFFPRYGQKQAETDSFRALSMDPLPDSLFQVPAGYTQTTVAQLTPQHPK